MTGVSRGGTGGRSSGYSSGGSRATAAAARRNRNSEKNHDDKGFVRRAAAAASVSHGSDDGRWLSLNKHINAVADYFDWSETDWMATCRALRVLYDECESKSGKSHPKCQSYLGSMNYEECDACPMTDEEGAGSGFRYSLVKFIVRGAYENRWDHQCSLLKGMYGQCRSNSGDDHPHCQFYRRWMIDEKCDDYLKKSDEEAADSLIQALDLLSVDSHGTCQKDFITQWSANAKNLSMMSVGLIWGITILCVRISAGR